MSEHGNEQAVRQGMSFDRAADELARQNDFVLGGKQTPTPCGNPFIHDAHDHEIEGRLAVCPGRFARPVDQLEQMLDDLETRAHGPVVTFVCRTRYRTPTGVVACQATYRRYPDGRWQRHDPFGWVGMPKAESGHDLVRVDELPAGPCEYRLTHDGSEVTE